MPEINVEADLNAVNDQLTKLVDELNKISAARENLVQQIQNLNGVSMYLRGKVNPEDAAASPIAAKETIEDGTFERSSEYPSDDIST